MQFATVARDGRITPAEVAVALSVKGKAEAMIRALQESVTAIDNAVSALERGGR